MKTLVRLPALTEISLSLASHCDILVPGSALPGPLPSAPSPAYSDSVCSASVSTSGCVCVRASEQASGVWEQAGLA